jgi:aminopeptidase N
MMKKYFSYMLLFMLCDANSMSYGQDQTTRQFSRADTLRGSNGPGRSSWDLLHYDITIIPDFVEKTISGKNIISLRDKGISTMQLDLQEPLIIDSIVSGTNRYAYTREGNVYWVKIRDNVDKMRFKDVSVKLTVFYHGKPKEAVKPPWDGGWIFKKDKNNNPWMSIACQDLGASSWFPCKEIQSDKPDSGTILNIVVPDTLVGIGNGRLIKKVREESGNTMYSWEVKNPINNYCIIPYIGKYTHFSEVFPGEKGRLDLDYWVLDYNLEKAKDHFLEVPKMLKAFEHWFGPYPFYEDGYKLVEAPYLGMENQSGIAYGNEYKKGYLGTDRSRTGAGLMWDFIIIHESGHEWFGNSITTADIADLWVHEAFTSYSEVLYTEMYYGKNNADKYCNGIRTEIENKFPSIGKYGVNDNPTNYTYDMYWKGSNMLHTMRQVINNDKKFRKILLGLNKNFYHKIVTGAMIQQYFSKEAGIDFSKVFEQYLSTPKVPVLEYKIQGEKVLYRWIDVVDQFTMPVKISIGNRTRWLKPTTSWQSISSRKYTATEITADKNFYIYVKKTDQ